jgi:transcriptional regulator NrdR
MPGLRRAIHDFERGAGHALIVKSDQSREPFDEAKLRGGMEKALEKRPVGREAIEAAVSRICGRLRGLGEREVDARTVGEFVMEELHHLDEVGYVRFASVYRSFQDVDAFRTRSSSWGSAAGRPRRDQLAAGVVRRLGAPSKPSHERAQPRPMKTGARCRWRSRWRSVACTPRIRIRACAAC